MIPLGVAALGLGYMVLRTIPELESRVDEVESDTRARIKTLETQLIAVRANLLSMCSKSGELGSACNIRELVASVQEINAAVAGLLEPVSATVGPGDAPQVSQEQLAALLPDWNPATSTPSTPASPSTVADVLTWTSAADGAKWVDKGDAFVVTFANGSASFRPDESMSGPVRAQLLESLQDTSLALKSNAVSAE